MKVYNFNTQDVSVFFAWDSTKRELYNQMNPDDIIPKDKLCFSCEYRTDNGNIFTTVTEDYEQYLTPQELADCVEWSKVPYSRGMF